jgi:hypothetical protein
MAVPGFTPPLFDHDFGKVKVHADSGPVLRRQPADTKAPPAPPPPAPPVKKGIGDADTTAPVAKLSPRQEMLNLVTDETTLFNNAQAIIDWVSKKAPAAPKAGDVATTDPATLAFSFTAEDLMKDAALLKKIKPKPAKEEDLAVMLDLMVTNGVVERVAPVAPATKPSFTLKRDAKTLQPDTAVFKKGRQDITKFKESLEQREKRPSPLDPMVETSILPKEMAAGAKEETDREKDAETKLTKLQAELQKINDSGATDEKTLEKKAALEKQIEKAQGAYTRAQGFHTFASDVTEILKRLRKKNTTWKAGTYPGHSWGEFSVDIFLSTSLVNVPDAGVYAGKFWKKDVVKTFFDDLNAVCEEDDKTTGKFAWRAIYNDIPLAGEINKKFGAGRVIQQANHGPDGQKLHIHLDLRPVKLKLDKKSGFEIDKGRIKLLP